MTDDNATRLHMEPIGIQLTNEQGQQYWVSEPSVVGRSKDVEIVIDDDQISRRHAQLKPLPDGLEVEDLGSSNGTYLNGKRLPAFIARDGDTIQFYTYKYAVRIAASDSGQAPAHDPDATRLHVPDAPVVAAPVATPVSEQPPQVESPPQPITSASSTEAAAGPVEKAWWDTSDKGVEGTLLLTPGAMDLDAEMTRLFNLGPAQQPRLVGMAAEYAGKTYELGAGKFIIGRDPGCDVRLDSDGISVKHAQIIHEGGTWKLVNLLSSNGTFVNGERIQTAYLNSGDELRFGAVGLLFQLPGGAMAKSAQPVAETTTAAVPEKSSGKGGLIAAAVGFIVVLVVGALLLL